MQIESHYNIRPRRNSFFGGQNLVLLNGLLSKNFFKYLAFRMVFPIFLRRGLKLMKKFTRAQINQHQLKLGMDKLINSSLIGRTYIGLNKLSYETDYHWILEFLRSTCGTVSILGDTYSVNRDFTSVKLKAQSFIGQYPLNTKRRRYFFDNFLFKNTWPLYMEFLRTAKKIINYQFKSEVQNGIYLGVSSQKSGFYVLGWSELQSDGEILFGLRN